jgi:23S rRNA (cytosine1962-C5)-methyltransferase
MQTLTIAKTIGSAGYELLDSGDGEKLERYGAVVLSRPDPQALWPKHLEVSEWDRAQAVFSRDASAAKWEFRGHVPERWEVELSGLKFFVRPSSFKHTGLFPEHVANWEWMGDKIKNQTRLPDGQESKMKNEVNILNLFGYTGGATLACAQAGASVCHVDGSKVAVAWARDNAALSGLHEKPIRWIVEDVLVFVKRELKRGHRYDGIIMDPPAFGHGPNKEMWRIEENFLPLMDLCKELLTPEPLFFLVNGYASGYSAIAYGNNIADLEKKFGGKMELGELTIEESQSGRLLPCGIFARWSRD